MTEIVVVVPVLGRPDAVAPVVDSFLNARTVPSRILFVYTEDDAAEQRAIQDAWQEVGARGAALQDIDWKPHPAPAGPGDFAKKMNLAFRESHEPFLFQASDDISFHPGWDTAVLRTIEETQTGVCGTDDGANPKVRQGRHSTHSLIRRSYIEECGGSLDGPGVVFSEAYGHQWVETELIELAKSRGCFSFAKDALVTHRHPIWKTAEMDETYRKGQASAQEDAALFKQRARQWA